MSSLRGTVYEEKIIKLIKDKAKVKKKVISKEEAEKILKQSQKQALTNEDNVKSNDVMKQTKKAETKKSPTKKAKSKTLIKKTKKVSKK